jgi:DNA polymerase-1
MTNKNTFVLVDAHAIIHRAYHAFPATLKTKAGEHINAVYGFTKILLEVIEKFKPEFIVVAFDSKGPTFRHEKFTEYKATRKKTDPELIEQFPRVKEIVEAFNIPILAKPTYEADDILGCIVTDKKCEEQNKIIVTGDHDILQLIPNPNTQVYIAGSSFSAAKLYDASTVKERYKFGPEYIVDYKALRGDSSDNIPGVRGIGEKTATDLILQFGHLDQIYESLEKISSASVKKKLVENKDMAFLSKELATIHCEFDFDLDLAKAEFADFDVEKVKEIFTRFSFSSLLNKIPPSKHAQNSSNLEFAIKEEKNNYVHLKTVKEIDSFLDKLEKQTIFAFDTETNGLNSISSKVLGISISWNENEGYFIDVDNNDFNEKHIERLKQVFENPEIKKVGHHIKFDAHMMANYTVKNLKLGIRMQNFYFDTMTAQYILSGSRSKQGLKGLAFTECGMQLSNLEDLWKDVAIKVKKNYTPEEVEYMMMQLDKEKLSYYASQDADATWRLYQIQIKQFEKELKLKSLFFDIEMPLVSILFNMERTGIKLDVDYLTNYGKKLEKQKAEMKDQIFKEIGHEFNIGSSKQVGEVLFDELKLPGGKKTKTGAWQTNERILFNYKTAHPVINMIIEYRELSKIISTYVVSLIDEVNREDGRIHTSYNQTIASTGRLSSIKPNLQNIPVSTDIGREVRRAFVAQEAKKLISFDISQQELRILAHLSNEAKLKEAFKAEIDVHKVTAGMLFKISEADITKKQRDMGKTLNYSLVYGISAYGLSDRLKISVDEAQDLIDRYFQIYPNVKAYFDSLIEKAKKEGKVETMYGRYRDASDLNNSNFRVRNATEREVINFPIQGTASDLMKLAMLKVANFLDKNKNEFGKLEPKILLQVHDELVFEVNDAEGIDDFAKKIIEQICSVGELDVPMKVEYNTGDNWAELK